MRINKKLKSLISVSVIIILLFGAGVVLKNIFLHQIKKKIQSSFGYTQLHFSLFPPSLILEDVRTLSLSPFFSAKRIAVRISYRSLLSKERPFNVFVENPILRIYGSSSKREKREKTRFQFSLPFDIEKGVIRDGELYFWGKEDRFQSKGINARFSQKKDYFSCKAEAEENVLSLGSMRHQIEGKGSFWIEGHGKEISVKRITIQGSDGILKAEGSLLDPFDPEFLLRSYFKIKTPFIAEFFNLPFEWEGKAEGKGILTRREGEIAIKARFSSKDLVLNKVFMGKVRGKIDFSQKAGVKIEFNIKKRSLPQEYVRIHFSGQRISGIARGFYLDPIINFVSLPWPTASPIWGNFTIDKGKLTADGEFRDEFLESEPDKFPFRGKVRFNWDGKNKISFSSQALALSFALVDVEGKVETGQDVDVTIQGEIIDIKQAREFTSLVLGKDFDFPEIRGKGRAKIRIFGSYESLQVQARFNLSPGGFGKFEANSVEGEAEIIKNDFLGEFRIDDHFMKGKIGLLSNQEGLRADIQVERGFVEKILPALDINLPLQGEASGNFELKQKKEKIQLKGSFSSSLIRVADQKLTEVSGRLDLQNDAFFFQELKFDLYDGRIEGYAGVLLSTGEFDIDIRGERIDLSSLYTAIKGNLSFGLKGRGVFGQDMASGEFGIKDLDYPPFKKTEIKGQAKLGYSGNRLTLELNGNVLPGENKVNVSLGFPLKEESFAGEVRGSFKNLSLLLPWEGSKGQVNYLLEIKGSSTSPQVKGAIDFKGPVFPFPGFAHALRDYSGLIFVDNNKVSLRSFQAKLGGGDVRGSGWVKLGKGGVENIDLKMEGKDLLLSPLERTRALADGTLNLIKDANRFTVEGDFLIHKLSWRREINEKIVFSSSPYYQPQTEPGFFDNLTLNIRLKADDNAWMENSLGRLRTRFDLSITGDVEAPIMLGDIEALEGYVYFQDREFKILRGQVSFFNPSTIEPYLSFKGETYVKDYRVTFSLSGLIDRLKPEFSSSPPLPPEDVLALLALGEAFKRTYSYDMSTQLSSASLISFQLSEEAKKRAEKLFGIDRFRIDPFILSSSAEMTARLTIGKKISKSFSILYSTNLTTQREEIARLEWELTDDLSVVGTRDEEGRISIDVKIHKRF